MQRLYFFHFQKKQISFYLNLTFKEPRIKISFPQPVHTEKGKMFFYIIKDIQTIDKHLLFKEKYFRS